jgi:hypothetical protein
VLCSTRPAAPAYPTIDDFNDAPRPPDILIDTLDLFRVIQRNTVF